MCKHKYIIFYYTFIATLKYVQSVECSNHVSNQCTRGTIHKLDMFCAAQSRDSENAQRNLETAQIVKLRGTYTSVCTITPFLSHYYKTKIQFFMLPFYSYSDIVGQTGVCSLVGIVVQ